jgi:hypothetical protein
MKNCSRMVPQQCGNTTGAETHLESVVVMWPQRPTAISPRHYSDLAATVCRLVANASTELAAIKAGKRQ